MKRPQGPFSSRYRVRFTSRQVERVAVISSVLRSVGYDHPTAILEVEFVNGLVYRYTAVPPHVHDSLMNAPSKGQYFNTHVRDCFPFSQVHDAR